MNCVVNIYIKEIWNGTLNVGSGKAAALIVFESALGQCHKKSVTTRVDDDTRKRLHLQIVTKALYELKKPCSVGIYMEQGDFIKNTITQGWPEQWARDGWKSSKGKEIKHADVWKLLLPKLQMHEIGIVDYISVYDDELMKILEDEYGEET